MGCDGLKPDLRFERLKILFSVPSSIDAKKISKMKFFSAARKIFVGKAFRSIGWLLAVQPGQTNLFCSQKKLAPRNAK